MAYTPLPTPPARNDPATFADRGDAFLGALPGFGEEMNAMQLSVADNEISTFASAAISVAAASAVYAGVAAVNATAWAGGVAYAVGAARYSLIDMQTYRRKVAGAGTTDPANDAANWERVGQSSLLYSARTAAPALTTSDKGCLIDLTLAGNATQAFSASATLRSGWFCCLRNSGTTDITLDPAGAELIDGLSGYVMYPGECRLIQCDGMALRSIVLNSFLRIFAASGAFVCPPGYKQFSGLAFGGGGGGGKGGYSGGGGGGACVPFTLPASVLAAGAAVTVGAGGTGPSAAANGVAGGTSSLGSLVLAYGGNGNNGNNGGAGGSMHAVGLGGLGVGFSGGSSGNGSTPTDPIGSVYGGGGGGYGSASNGSSAGAASLYGAGGGAGISISQFKAGGDSGFAGAGGASANTESGINGAAPGGGGGATAMGAKAGDGGRGEIRIWGIV